MVQGVLTRAGEDRPRQPAAAKRDGRLLKDRRGQCAHPTPWAPQGADAHCAAGAGAMAVHRGSVKTSRNPRFLGAEGGCLAGHDRYLGTGVRRGAFVVPVTAYQMTRQLAATDFKTRVSFGPPVMDTGSCPPSCARVTRI